MDIVDEIAAGESYTLEFKEDVNSDPKKFLKTVSAFANCSGGRVIFGVNDSKEIVGLEGNLQKKMDSLTDMISEAVKPMPDFNINITTVDGKDLIIVDIRPGRHRPYYLGDDPQKGTYIRVMATTRLCDEFTFRDLLMQGMNRSFDRIEYINEAISEDDKGLIELCQYASFRSKRIIGPIDLVNQNLLIDKDNYFVTTNGYRLLTDNPFDYAHIECKRFRGKDVRVILDSKEYRGNLMEQVEESLKFVLNYLMLGSDFKRAQRIDSYEIPENAIREFIINAVIHRSYSVHITPIYISVFDDRIEILSPGNFPYGLSIDEILKGFSNPRNPSIASFFKIIGFAEGWGSGIKRASLECVSVGLRSPLVEEVGNNVRVTIFRKSYQGDREEIMDVGSIQIVELMSENNDLKIDDIVKKTGLSKSGINNRISFLKEKGVIERVGSKKTGHWKVNEEKMISSD